MLIHAPLDQAAFADTPGLGGGKPESSPARSNPTTRRQSVSDILGEIIGLGLFLFFLIGLPGITAYVFIVKRKWK